MNGSARAFLGAWRAVRPGVQGCAARRGLASAAALPDGVLVAPSARILLASNPSLDLPALAKTVSGRMPNGFIVVTKADVLIALGKAPAPKPAAAKPAAPAAPPPPQPAKAASAPATPPPPAREPAAGVAAAEGGGGAPSVRSKAHRSHEDVPVTQMRKIIAKRLLESKLQFPHSYMTIEIQMDNLIKARQEYNERLGQKVSVNDFVIKAAATALKEVPEANAYWTENAIKFNPTVDVAFAAATPAGLVTPVVRSADSKKISEIAKETKDLAGRARANKLFPEEFQGGSLSVSNLGMFDMSEFIAVLNPPQSAIFAVGSTQQKAFPDGKGGLEARSVMMVSLSHDERVIDGQMAAKLCTTLQALIQTPALMFM